ncbi:D-ribose pyranase [Fervidibacillus halotolerans]|uniref:D-ribose pyranase n=1 Tax=Fervidibacillus halotolerans TaxID=2980027 RepID=A0A9E8RY70_9BACI|nr:D-ribose pyranase [Fervidibacillus halotolerans]WAA12541.1 D-ribose pyranase [Fervidibacillus halotolerans]
MKKSGVLNSEISKVLADLGHTDTIIIADCGLPIPQGVKKIDLSLELGKPSFMEVLNIVRKDMVIEKVTLASEITEQNKPLLKELTEQFSEIEFITHEVLKEQSKKAAAIIRTGEATPYANIILHAGVIF